MQKLRVQLMELRKHIAPFLFWIFFFPILFQSVHIVWHNSQTNKNEYRCCHTETCDTDSPDESENITQKEDVCQICEYQFSLNDLPGISIFRSIIPSFSYSLNVIAFQQDFKQGFTVKSPRAPPLFIFIK